MKKLLMGTILLALSIVVANPSMAEVNISFEFLYLHSSSFGRLRM